MARLRQRFAFTPSVFPQSLFLSVHLAPLLAYTYTVQSCQVYPSADTVVILDATSLRFLRALAFSQVFPGVSANSKITSLAVDPALKLVRTTPPAFLPSVIHLYPAYR